MAYKIYTKVNTADSWRDDDAYIYNHIGTARTIKDALKQANDYINDHFFSKSKLRQDGDNYTATDFCSYAETIIVEKINQKTYLQIQNLK